MSLGRILITGVNGFFGKYLSSHLTLNYPESQIYGTDIIEKALSLSSIEFLRSNLVDTEDTNKTVARIQPDTVFHLAGIFDRGDLGSLYQINVIGTDNLMQALAKLSKNIKVILASSAAVYGEIRVEDNPVSEDIPMSPVSHYGISKMAMERTGAIYGKKYSHLDIIAARTFNLIGVGLSPMLLPGKLSQKISDVAKSSEQKTINVGNTHTVRDFIDVRDAVRALTLLAIQGKKNNAYNIGSGKGIKIEDLINLFIKSIDPSIEVISDQSLCKENDPEIVTASIFKINNHTGWTSEISLEESVSTLMKLKNSPQE